ncbi:proton-coupled zinc antiporter SLC30A5-like [Styela clava]
MNENDDLGRITAAARESLGKHGLLLMVVKMIRCIGLFECYDLLKVVHLVYFLFFVKAWSSVVLTLLHKPISHGKRVVKRQWASIAKYSLLGVVNDILWLFGLTLCGPLRTILIFEHSEAVILAMLSGIFSPSGNHSKTRGAILFLISASCLLLFDNDDLMTKISDHPEGQHAGTVSHTIYWLISKLGVADHKGGIILLIIASLLKVAHSVMGKRLSNDVGGPKRLHALSTLVSTILLTPWAMILYLSGSSGGSLMSYTLPFLLVVLFVFLFNFYVESYVTAAKQDSWKSYRIGYMTITLSALLLAYHWHHPAARAISQLGSETRTSEHVMSSGVVISALLFIWATIILTRPASKSQKGSFVGYSAQGQPLYNFAGDALQRATQLSFAVTARKFLSKVLQKRNSRHIFYFLCMNLGFAFVELFYGVWSNSLGLISDSFHMLFDCTALVLGLVASVMVQWQPTRVFSYGYGRVEVLAGFVNGLFLLVIALFLLAEAFQRLFNPPKINTDRLLIVSIGGFLVNLVGVTIFSHNHSHGHSHSEHCSHGDKHHHHDHGSGNSNIKGIYLHILADLLGSVGVIISSFLIGQFGLLISDPICTLLIGCLILMTVWPLLRDSARVLALRIPQELEKDIQRALMKVQNIEGVISIRSRQIWRHSESEVIGWISVQVSPHVIEQRIISQVTPILKEAGITSATVQVEKEDFYQHMSGLSTNTDEMLRMTKESQSIYHSPTNRQTDDDFAKLI